MPADLADQHVATALDHLRGARWAEAAAAAQAALQLRPGQPDAVHVLGIVAWKTGRLAEAVQLLGATVAAVPAYAEAHKNLGMVLQELGQPGQAIACFRKATELAPNMADAHFQLATLLREKGDVDAAIVIYQRVLAIDPHYAPALNDLGAVLKNRGRLAEAIAYFRRALEVFPNYVVGLINLAGALMDHGDPDAARDLYARARELAPELPDARFGYCLSFIPISYAREAEIAESRAAYARELAALDAHYAAAPASELAAAAQVAGQHLPFYLAYQGEDDRPLQERFGAVFARTMAAGYPEFAGRPPMPPAGAGEPIRVGVVSGFFRSHTVWKLFGGWVREMDRSRFKLHGYSTSLRRDPETSRAKAAFDVFVETAHSFEALAGTIRAHQLHVLLYPEIGMDQATARLAALRLAPIQAASWGHPETSGLPTIDYFLSSDLMEPQGAEAFYTERLVRLPHLSIHYAPPDVTPAAPDLAGLGVRPAAVKYLCCQSLYKYLPRNDDVFPKIAAGVPDAQFLFIRHHAAPEVTALTQRRLAAAFAAHGLDAARHVVFVPSLDGSHYAGLNAASDVYLDSLEWSGGNTTLEALTAGLPIVTLPGRLMRGRHTAAILAMLGLEQTIARDKDDYVALAIRLGREVEWRKTLALEVARRRDRVYRDATPVRALETLIEGWVRRPLAS
ncbi:MAG TPA: tetratricopeptide repeat protein [Alphaproteobacteria bacterium]|nr:tetratricopeptide repeat protein [Alphaproteobacteria bacterium]